MSTKKVCVVGAGPSGLACARQMLDYGFDVVLYERSAELGGLWVYHDDDVEGRASVMRTTVINTSKEMSAFRSTGGHAPGIGQAPLTSTEVERPSPSRRAQSAGDKRERERDTWAGDVGFAIESGHRDHSACYLRDCSSFLRRSAA
ncbi:hypothetical protein HPB51_019636 [Rhipicephalus microplus]|uniref:Flavin-containing monooxygenase n=1 Tax=Rhipicephalus microplus TaxID=6941 RepID=A0A9J6EBA4_RHIMP|nr:hypothetical protein HPB51_019636 [Rhipicephalus microplus]